MNNYLCETCYDFSINWDAVTACGTIALAILTFYLANSAIRQLKDIKSSSMENIIMKQLEFHYKIVEKINPEGNPEKEDAFKYLYAKLAKSYYFNSEIIRYDDESIKNNIGVAYGELYSKYGNLLGHYYRNLYRTFKNINETKIEGFDKKYYAKLVRAQLSEYEVLLLFYNCLWIGDNNKFKKLVEDYELLEGINFSKLLDKEHIELFSLNAFGEDY